MYAVFVSALDLLRIKKSLGRDFLDPSQLGYGFLKNSRTNVPFAMKSDQSSFSNTVTINFY